MRGWGVPGRAMLGTWHNHCTHKLTAAMVTCTTANQQGQSTFQQAVQTGLSGLLTRKGEDVKGERGRLRAFRGVEGRDWRVLGGLGRGTWGCLWSRRILYLYEIIKDKQKIFYQKYFTVWAWNGSLWWTWTIVRTGIKKQWNLKTR